MINAYPENLATTLTKHYGQLCGSESSLYAVIDHSFDPTLLTKLRGEIDWISIYSERGNPDVEICPLLCTIDTKNEFSLLQQLRLVLNATSEQPMLSFWVSVHDRKYILSHFDHYFDVNIEPEKLSYILRYADTRILPSLIEHFTSEQKAHFLRPFAEVIYFDRSAQPVHVRPTDQPQHPQQSIVLNEKQFAALLDASLPDQIWQQYRRLSLSDQLPVLASDAYSLILQHCQQAEKLGFVGFAEVMTYSLEQLTAIPSS